MISAGDFRNGITIELEGNIYQIIEFQHVKPGKGAAFVRTKLKNIKSGGVVEKTFRPTEKCPQARIDRKDMQYLYSDGDLYYFMDVENYEQIALDKTTIGDTYLKICKKRTKCVKSVLTMATYLLLNHHCLLNFRLQRQNLDSRVILQTGATKPATVETGATVMVPLFVEQDDVIKIDTRTGEYLSRV